MKKWIIIGIAILLLVCSITVLLDYFGLGGKTVTVSIPQGAGAKEIVSILKTNRIIRFPSLFRRYIRDEAAHLRAGVHTFRVSMGYEKTLEELKNDVPLENTIAITIPEGYEAREIGQLLESAGIVASEEFIAACETAHKRHGFLPETGNIEGYLFPATYALQAGMDAVTVVDMMLRSFVDKMYTEENIARSEALSLSFHEALTLASIIEREAAKDDERSIVASVFHNRLRIGMRLESCATVQYILKERKDVLSIADTKIDSPYNTYLHAGLPPTPIASPGVESMQAALYPENTNYLFFVADGSGGHTFSETYEAHLNASNG